MNTEFAMRERLFSIYERGDVAGRALAREVIAITSNYEPRTRGDLRLVTNLMDAIGRYTEASKSEGR